MTGSQGEPIEALQKMAKQIDKVINIQKGDTVLIAASPLRGSEVFLFKTVDMLFRAGANVISGKRAIHVSSHGSQEELKFMINLMKPKYLIPVHGEYRMLKAHRKLALECGLTDEQILIPDRGDILEWKEGKLALAGKVPSGNILIDGIGVGDVGNIVLRDRRLLSQDGILIVVVTLTKQIRKIAAGPEIISRGFVYVRESEKLMEESTKLVRDIVERNIAKDTFEWSSLKQDIREELNRNLYEKTKRRPMILPIIMEI
jgi:ribonuclease J